MIVTVAQVVVALVTIKALTIGSEFNVVRWLCGQPQVVRVRLANGETAEMERA